MTLELIILNIQVLSMMMCPPLNICWVLGGQPDVTCQSRAKCDQRGDLLEGLREIPDIRAGSQVSRERELRPDPCDNHRPSAEWELITELTFLYRDQSRQTF